MLIGYARVSTGEQNLEQQVEALNNAGCERIFMEKKSGTNKNRPELQRMIDLLREGDTVIVWKLDRLGRSTKHLIPLVTEWHQQGISFKSLSDGFTFDQSAFGKVIFTMMCAFAELERDLISERTKAGLAQARKKGRTGGRPKGMTKAARIKAKAAAQMYQEDKLSVTEICRELVIARSTFYRYLRIEGVKLNCATNL